MANKKPNFKKGSEAEKAMTDDKPKAAAKPAKETAAKTTAKTPPDKKKAAPKTPKPTPEPDVAANAAPEPDVIHEAEIVGDDALETSMLAPDGLSEIKALGTAVGQKRKLTDGEQAELLEYETAIEQGLKNYITIGKNLFAIWNGRLFSGEFTSWRDYVKARWGMSASGAYDLMKAFRTWRLASSDSGMTFAAAVSPTRWLGDGSTNAPTPDDKKPADKAKPTSDAAAPSQRAIDEMAKFTPFLQRGEMSDDDFAEFEKMALKYLYETVLDLGGEKITQTVVREVMDAFVEFAKSRAFEIDGEQVDVSAADFRISKGVFEAMVADKQSVRAAWDERRQRMSEPAERDQKEYVMTPDPNAAAVDVPTLQLVRCSHHGDCDIVKIMFGAIQLSCGDVFGMAKGSTEIQFNPKLTADNPLEDGE